jgi:hypothetical protein
MKTVIALLLVGLIPAAASAQTKDHPPSALPYAGSLTHVKGESWSYFKPKLDLSRYDAITVDETAVYSGPDAQFDDIDPADRAKFASIITNELRSAMAKSFPSTGGPNEHRARLRVTLIGAEKTTGGVATATRVMPIGFAVNAVKSIAGKPGAMTGSILYAAELTDAATGELQAAAVRRESPDALDISATVSTTDTVKAVAQEMAENIRKKLANAAAGTAR